MPAKYARKKKKKTNRNRKAIIICCVAVAVILAALAFGLNYVGNANGTILENISVAGVDVGGMTQAEAIDAVSKVAHEYNERIMTVSVLDSKVTIGPQISGASLNIRAAVRDAYKYGHSGSSAKRQEEAENAAMNGYQVNLSKHLNLNEQAIRNMLDKIGNQYNSTLSQTTYEVSGTAPNQKLIVHLGVPEYGLDMDVLYNQVMAGYSARAFDVTGEIGLIKPDDIDLKAILAQHGTEPVDAYYDKETFRLVEGVNGYGFNLEKTKKLLAEAAYGSTVEIPFTDIPPQVTMQDLTENLYKDVLATYTANYKSETNRDTNLRLACEAIDGFVLYPGETFSYNEVLGERTAAKGYKPGPSFSGDQTVDTIGGGICQVSSSLYYCALVADLDIVTRKNHGFTVSYTPLGMDAAVSWGTLDFRFKNNTESPIRIEASSNGGNVTVSIKGTDEKDYYVKMEYEVLSTYAYSTTYKTLDANNAEGYKDGDYIVEPHTGYTVQTYRCKYSKETDQLISKDKEVASYYDKRDAVVCKISGNSGGSQGIGNGGVSEDGALP